MQHSKDVLEQAIEKLSVMVNVATGIVHPADGSMAKELFKALHQCGVSCGHDAVLKIAKRQGWSEKHAKSLAELAGKIDQGGRVQISHKTGWGERTVSDLLTRIDL